MPASPNRLAELLRFGIVRVKLDQPGQHFQRRAAFTRAAPSQ